MKKVLVTGANGYIGRHVIEFLCTQNNIDVFSCDISDAKFSGTKHIVKNILDESKNENLYKELGEPDIIVHLAWQDGFKHNADSHLNNLSKHFDFLRNMVDAGCKNISIMGTMHEIGYWEGEINADTPCKPLSMYGIAKNALRQAIMNYVEDKDVSLKWLRAYYITGDDKFNNSIFAKILQMAEEGKKMFPFTDGKNKYDFIDVNELAKQISLASIQTNVSGIINVCSGNPVSLKDKVEAFIEEKGLDIKPEYGVYPSRKYDSPIVYGNPDLIKQILMDL